MPLIMNTGLIGAITGVTIGFIGGIIGTYCSIKNTNGPKEKLFMIKATVIGWIAMVIFLVLLIYLPKPYNYLMWIPYGILLPLGIICINKKQREIQKQEEEK